MSDAAADAAPAPANPPPPPSAQSPPPPSPASWRDGLPDDLKGAKSLEKFTDPAGLAKSYVELEAMVGRKGVIVPKEGDAPDVVAAFHKALGVPDAAEGYALTRPSDIPEALWTAERIGEIAGWAHAAKLTPQQAQGLAVEMAKQVQAIEARDKAEIEALRGRWGASFDARVEIGKRAAKQFGLDDATIGALTTAMGASRLLEFMHKVGERMGEDRPAGMGATGSPGGTASEAEAEMARIRGDRTGPYYDRMHPQHQATVDRMTALHRIVAATQRAA